MILTAEEVLTKIDEVKTVTVEVKATTDEVMTTEKATPRILTHTIMRTRSERRVNFCCIGRF